MKTFALLGLIGVMAEATLLGQTPARFTVTVTKAENGTIAISPALPADGKLPGGSVITVTATPDTGFAVDSVFYAIRGVFGREAYETAAPSLKVTIDRDKEISASFIDQKALEGFTLKEDIVYAQPGVKKLKYDVFTPNGAHNLPAIIIVHGGGWVANREDIMRGLARELVRGGRYVVASIDYRWFGTHDGDKTPTTMNQIVEDVFGAIAHFQEHAAAYGADPTRLAVTGDSAGGYLSAAAIILVDKLGDAGFGKTEGVYQLKPTYLPSGKSVAPIISWTVWESGGQPHFTATFEAFIEDFSAAVDFLGTKPFVDRERIGVIGICGSGSFGLAAAETDPRIKAVTTVSMYDKAQLTSDERS